MNRKYNCKVSSNNSRRLLTNCKNDRGSLYCRALYISYMNMLPEMELRLLPV